LSPSNEAVTVLNLHHKHKFTIT